MNKQYSIKLPSDRKSVEKAVKLAEKVARKMKLISQEQDNLAIAVSEAVTNAVVHGNKLNSEKEAVMDIITKDNEIIVKVKDQGNGFKPDKLPDPLAPENIAKECGRGVFILKNFMDCVDYNFTKEGTEIIISKKYDKNCFKK